MSSIPKLYWKVFWGGVVLLLLILFTGMYAGRSVMRFDPVLLASAYLTLAEDIVVLLVGFWLMHIFWENYERNRKQKTYCLQARCILLTVLVVVERGRYHLNHGSPSIEGLTNGQGKALLNGYDELICGILKDVQSRWQQARYELTQASSWPDKLACKDISSVFQSEPIIQKLSTFHRAIPYEEDIARLLDQLKAILEMTISQIENVDH